MYSAWPVQPHWAAGEDADSLSLFCLPEPVDASWIQEW